LAAPLAIASETNTATSASLGYMPLNNCIETLPPRCDPRGSTWDCHGDREV
jgi:hypothetical protein